MLTIQELHQHAKLQEIGAAEEILCTEDHAMTPWDDDGEALFRCPFCMELRHIGINLEERIRTELSSTNLELNSD